MRRASPGELLHEQVDAVACIRQQFQVQQLVIDGHFTQLVEFGQEFAELVSLPVRMRRILLAMLFG